MLRRHLLQAMSLLPLTLTGCFGMDRHQRAVWSAKQRLCEATRLNDLAASIHSPDDALVLVDFVAEEFTESLPTAWPRNFRKPLAQVEYLAVRNNEAGIAEQHIADTWNGYVTKIGGPAECRGIAAELHNLRDALLVTNRLAWASGNRTIWTAPAIYAAQPDGLPAVNCRGVEALRLLWDLANMPDNLLAARQRVQNGQLVSEQVRSTPATPQQAGGLVTFSIHESSDIEVAQRNYVHANGGTALLKAASSMVHTLLSA